jgi:hypothetical protein
VSLLPMLRSAGVARGEAGECEGDYLRVERRQDDCRQSRNPRRHHRQAREAPNTVPVTPRSGKVGTGMAGKRQADQWRAP